MEIIPKVHQLINGYKIYSMFYNEISPICLKRSLVYVHTCVYINAYIWHLHTKYIIIQMTSSYECIHTNEYNICIQMYACES